jgi:hypothetical protein
MNISDIKIGDYIIVESKPCDWSSYLCSNNIKEINTYPYLAKIIDIKNCGDYNAVLVEVDGQNYGASLSSLVEVSVMFEPTEHCLEVISLNTGYILSIGTMLKISRIDIDGDFWFTCSEYSSEKCLLKTRLNVDVKYAIKAGYTSSSQIKEKEESIIVFIPKEIPLYKDNSITLPVRKKINKPLTQIQQQLINILLYTPEKYREYISKMDNPSYGVTFINKLLPSRVGYEFDTVGYKEFPKDLINIFDNTCLQKKRGKNNSIFITNWDKHYDSRTDNREIRISFNNITGFKKLKFLLHKMVEYGVKPAENGGLHIHINTAPILIYSEHIGDIPYLKKVTKPLHRYRKYIYNVFDIPKDDSHIRSNESFIKFHDRGRISVLKQHDTLEWRLSNTTFDYTQIMKWTIFSHLMTELVKYPSKEFNMDLFENIRYS